MENNEFPGVNHKYWSDSEKLAVVDVAERFKLTLPMEELYRFVGSMMGPMDEIALDTTLRDINSIEDLPSEIEDIMEEYGRRAMSSLKPRTKSPVPKELTQEIPMCIGDDPEYEQYMMKVVVQTLIDISDETFLKNAEAIIDGDVFPEIKKYVAQKVAIIVATRTKIFNEIFASVMGKVRF